MCPSTQMNGGAKFRALLRQFPNILYYAQKRCARGDTAPLTSAIHCGRFIADNSWATDHFNEPQLFLDRRLVLTGAARKPRKEIRDILSWVDAFTVYSVTLASYFPQR